ncbi:purine-binding chemotaxis protein CheW [Caldichromatium japonicum]|uniref:Chemotaxis protein CheW n=1 Tax=Caldichromatium japonicum TaxID=2699430 RepID=A0A6G7V9X9_9GAMM|nr:chemotaxis protein CheW [Caldichromatium japonicum]QIK36666.1 purine-binding chemotaxis protein CheW [Caldichromatium japonicum]
MSAEHLQEAAVDEEGTESADVHQFVTFVVGGEVFAVDMAPVQEIIRLPAVVRVPLAPSSLLGLANLRGKVLPIILLRRIFGFPEQAHDDATRALVIDVGQPLGFVVDRVASVISVRSEQIEPVAGIQGTFNSELLTGILKDVGGFAMVMVLNFARLVAQEFAEIAQIARGTAMTGGVLDSSADNEDKEASDELQLVSFAVAGQEYAIDITSVQEIVQIPETIVHVPNSPTHVLGLMTLRERLLPLVSLRSLFALPARALDEKSRIVVVALGQAAVGIITDSVSEVLRVPLAQVDRMPGLLAREDALSDITEICRLDGGRRLVAILSVDNMFKHTVVQEALKTVDGMNANTHDEQPGEDRSDEEEQLVVFRLAESEFGVPIESVQEIVRLPDELTPVPKAPAYVEGVINLRGAVLPVIDQRKRLGLPPIERNDRQRIMVFVLNGVRTGFIVDTVTEVLKIPKAAIETAPRLSGEQARLLGRVANLEQQGRMIQLIEPAHLIDTTELADLNT